MSLTAFCGCRLRSVPGRHYTQLTFNSVDTRPFSLEEQASEEKVVKMKDHLKLWHPTFHNGEKLRREAARQCCEQQE